MLVFVGVAICTSTSIAETQYEWENDDEAINNGAIDVDIIYPPDDTYVTINGEKGLACTASDPDCERNKPDGGAWSDWYPISDDVTSGNTSSNYHILWTFTGDGEILDEDKYYTSSLYTAPDYSEGNDVRDVTITATADDIDRGNESPTNKGYKESDANDSITLKIWQVTVTAQQSGTTSTNYDGTAMPQYYGDTDLGWITPNDPNAAGYHGNTQIKGSIPSGPNVQTGYSWSQYFKGYARYKVNGGSWVYDPNEPDWKEDGTALTDCDSRHPNGGGTDVREIFTLDAPGFTAGYDNNDYIGNPHNWTDAENKLDFKTYVNYGGNRISNEDCIWEVDFVLDVNEADSTWIPVGEHTP